jgi:hypothetical protein
MSDRTRLLGAALALCAALVVTMAVTEAGAYPCNVDRIRVTTRTSSIEGSGYPDSSSVYFRFGTSLSWFNSFYLNNPGIDDFKEGAIDEFVKEWTSNKPVYPTNFQRLRIEAHSPSNAWGLTGMKLEFMCEGTTSWNTLFVNRGINTNLEDGTTTWYYETSVGSAGSDTYNGAHEVFWLFNIGDNSMFPNGIPDDLSNCDEDSPTADVECRMGAVLVDGANATIVDTQLTESWWDVNRNGGLDIVNPLEYTPPEENSNAFTNNFWRWFWTSGNFTHNAVNKARLVLSDCTHSILPVNEGNCSMQADYLHADVMQSWAYSTYANLRFMAHVYEGDFGIDGYMTIPPGNTGAKDYVETTASRLKNIWYTESHVESQQDSEHEYNQQANACGYMSTDMILSTRGFSTEEISNAPPFDEADTWQEAAALAHLVWGYKEMCCGSWNCCPDPSNCLSLTIPGHIGTWTKCGSTNYMAWWTSSRCDWDPSSNDYCFGRPGSVDPTDPPSTWAWDNFFWRNQNTDLEVTESERWTALINYNGEIQWTNFGSSGPAGVQ